MDCADPIQLSVTGVDALEVSSQDSSISIPNQVCEEKKTHESQKYVSESEL